MEKFSEKITKQVAPFKDNIDVMLGLFKSQQPFRISDDGLVKVVGLFFDRLHQRYEIQLDNETVFYIRKPD